MDGDISWKDVTASASRMQMAEARIKNLEQRLAAMEMRMSKQEGGSSARDDPSVQQRDGWFFSSSDAPADADASGAAPGADADVDPLIFSRAKEDRAQLATLFTTFWEHKYDSAHVCTLPSDSIYSAFYVFPMVAKSSEWNYTFTFISIKICLLSVLSLVTQFLLLHALKRATYRRRQLDGIPYLCSYGQEPGLSEHPPVGPLGIEILPDKSNIETDYTMVILRNTLAYIMLQFGYKADDIANIGPVEYAIEDYTIRFVCLGLFLVCVAKSIMEVWSMLNFLRRIPSKFDSWIQVDDPGERGDKRFWDIIDRNELYHCKFVCNGMPVGFKIVCFILQMFVLLTVVTCTMLGCVFLLETAAISDLILNSLALTFILDVDEYIFASFTKHMTVDIMNRLEPFCIESDWEEKEEETERKYVNSEKFRKAFDNTHASYDWYTSPTKFAKAIFRYKTLRYFGPFLCTCGLWFFVIWIYYAENCEQVQRPFSLFTTHQYYSSQNGIWWKQLFGEWETKKVSVGGDWTNRLFSQEETGDVTCEPFAGPNSNERGRGCGMVHNWNEVKGLFQGNKSLGLQTDLQVWLKQMVNASIGNLPQFKDKAQLPVQPAGISRTETKIEGAVLNGQVDVGQLPPKQAVATFFGANNSVLAASSTPVPAAANTLAPTGTITPYFMQADPSDER